MHLKLIACEVFYREVCSAVARSPHTVSVEFLAIESHLQSDVLRLEIQHRIDAARDESFHAILLGFGLCGNGTVGLKARNVPLVLPRAHDCCSLFLGSRRAFKDHFGTNPSRPFSCLGLMERGGGYVYDAALRQLLGSEHSFAEYVELYGADNAQYIMEALKGVQQHDDEIIYIEMPESAHLGWAGLAKEQARADGKRIKLVEGSSRLLNNLIYGDWDEQEFLLVKPGHVIQGVYDWDEICRAQKLDEERPRD